MPKQPRLAEPSQPMENTHFGRLYSHLASISTSKSKAIVLWQKTVDCSLQFWGGGGHLLLEVLFPNNGKMERVMDWLCGAASAFVTVAVKGGELSQKAKLLIYQSSDVPSLTYGYEFWVVTERMTLWIQAAERFAMLLVSESYKCKYGDKIS